MVGVQVFILDGVQVAAYTDAIGEDDDGEELEEDDAYFLAPHELWEGEHLTFDAGLLAVRDVYHINYNSQQGG